MNDSYYRIPHNQRQWISREIREHKGASAIRYTAPLFLDEKDNRTLPRGRQTDLVRSPDFRLDSCTESLTRPMEPIRRHRMPFSELPRRTQNLRAGSRSASLQMRIPHGARCIPETGSHQTNSKHKMKEILKGILMGTVLLRVWNRWLGKNRVRVSGKRNRIQVGQSLLTRTLIRVAGQNNEVSVGDGCRLHDLKILVAGDSLRVEIADHCRLRGKIKAENVSRKLIYCLRPAQAI